MDTITIAEESLAATKTEETGLREMEKSKTNTEMFPG
jgi:hypothetical protein